ncbi:GUN4-like protein [Actinokineospora auranticolor]|uniref:GUN4-like protein n=1 Tax=Actinokineospora auranticolor TaxID=155976 RepID=A0A2S6GRJ6_9PSEU|nr:GUN4-like protein [Actinokineospora auranticolor]
MPPGLYKRVAIGVDIRDYHRFTHWEQDEVQRALNRVLDLAAAAAYLDRGQWERDSAGDGEVALLPGDVNLVPVVRDFPMTLDRALADHNRANPTRSLQLRLAMVFDVFSPADLGWAGVGMTVLNRLLNAQQARAALVDVPTATVVQILCGKLFEAAVEPEMHGLRRADFTNVIVHSRQKGFHQAAHLRVIGHAPPLPPPKPRNLADVVAELATPEPVRPADPDPPKPPERPPSPPLGPAVEKAVAAVAAALSHDDVLAADNLTTMAVLEAVDRTLQGTVRTADGPNLPLALFAALDKPWSEFSGDRWGFRAQRHLLAGLGLRDSRFDELCERLGWWSDDPARRYPGFTARATRDRPFYPTLRHPDRECFPEWRDEWKRTVMTVHQRIQDWE